MIITTYKDDFKMCASQFAAVGLFVFCWTVLFKMMF